MKGQIAALLAEIQAIPAFPADVPAAGAAAPPVGTLPPPHVSWAVIGLVHYRARKHWARRVMGERLRPQLRVLATNPHGGLAQSGCPRAGTVPGLPDWAFDLAEPTATTLTHRGTGEVVHVDLLNGPEIMCHSQFRRHFRDQRDPGPAQGRLGQLFPAGAGLWLVLRLLRREGLLHDVADEVFQLCGMLAGYSECVARFLDAWSEPEQRYGLAVRIGDWPATREVAAALGRSDLAAQAGPRAEACRQQWLGLLRRWEARHGLFNDLLLALAAVGAADLPRHLERALGRPEMVGTAIELFREPRLVPARLRAAASRPAAPRRRVRQHPSLRPLPGAARLPRPRGARAPPR